MLPVPNPASVAYWSCTGPIDPALVETSDETAAVWSASSPLVSAGHSDSGEVAVMIPALPDWLFSKLANAFQSAGCSSMHHSCSTKFVPAGSLSVTGRMARFGRLTPGLLAAICELFQFVIPPVRMAHAV